MSSMFYNTSSFNQPLDNWDTAKVTNMSSMFSGSDAFNQSINNWNVSQVSYFSGMFSSSSAFNQPLDNWNTASATNLSYMFSNSTAFNQSLATFNIANVTNATSILNLSSVSTNNYDMTLAAWSQQTVVPGVSMSAQPTKYCNASARNVLTSEPNNWTITDGGQANAADCPLEVEISLRSNEILSTETTPYTVGHFNLSGQVNPDEAYIYTLLGDGADNSSFIIEDNSLILTSPINYPQKINYEITVRVTDFQGSFHDQTLNMTVVDGSTPEPEPTPTPDPIDPDNGDNSSEADSDIIAPNTGFKPSVTIGNALILIVVFLGGVSAVIMSKVKSVKIYRNKR